MVNKLFVILIIILIPLIYFAFTKAAKYGEELNGAQLIRECPDSWIENRMPNRSGESNEGREYFIIDGERHEIEEYDLTWIRENCNIKPKIVY